MMECSKCGAVGTIVDLGACCRIRAMIKAEGGTGGALPEDLRTAEAWRIQLVSNKPFNTKGNT